MKLNLNTHRAGGITQIRRLSILLLACSCLLGLVSDAEAQGGVIRTGRFYRGTGSNPTFHSLVIPLDFEKGLTLDNTNGNVSNFYPVNPWTANYYHYDATNAASSTNLALRIVHKNPIVAFGERFGGTPLYLNQPYEFGIYAGDPDIYYDITVRLKVYARSNSAVLATFYIPIPDVFDTNQFPTIVNESFTTTTVMANYGLMTVLSDHPFQRWGNQVPGAVILRHTAISSVATNFFFVVEDSGYGAPNGAIALVKDGSNFDEWSKLYVMEF